MIYFSRERLYRIVIFIFLLTAPVAAGDLEISWMENTEPDLAGYRLYYGNSSGNYDQKIDVGNKTITVVQDLKDGLEYYFSLTAYDSAGNESGFSKESFCVLNDSRQLTVDSVRVLSAFDIVAVFNKKVDPVTSQNPENYSIDGNIQISKALLQKDGKSVRLITDGHEYDITYTLLINNVLDISLPSNKISNGTVTYQVIEKKLDVIPPAVILINAVSPTNIDIYFNEPVNAASATDIRNYSIDHNINISSAAMKEENIVRLETLPQSVNLIYNLTLNNIFDTSDNKNIIHDNSSFLYSYSPGDITSPAISLVHLPRNDQIDIMFNEPVTRKSAESLTNYSINGGIQVHSAQLDTNHQVVHLNTTEHRTDRHYAVKINYISDLSPYANTVSSGMENTYLYGPPDLISPFIRTVEVIDNTHINIFLSEKVDEITAERAENYIINSGVQVLEAQLTITDDIIKLVTTPHVFNKIYSIAIKGVRDCSFNSNETDDTFYFQYAVESENNQTGPLIAGVEVKDSTTVNVYFNNPVDIKSAENINNYIIDNEMGILSATLDNKVNIVKLKTLPHQAMKTYTLSTNGIYLNGQNSTYLPPANNIRYVYKGGDNLGPVITLVKPVDNENIDILFNEALALSEAEKTENFRIMEGLNILEARLDATKHVVHLRTEPHSLGQKYTLRINNITDDSPKQNLCRPNSFFTYKTDDKDDLPPFIKRVNVIDTELLEIHFSEHVNENDILLMENYDLNNDIEIFSIERGGAGNIVEMKTGILEPGTLYDLQVRGIRDLSNNMIPENNTYSFYYHSSPSPTGPKITNIKSIKNNEIILNFDKELSKETAEDIGNYRIDGNVKIVSAELQTLPEQVKLRTTEHQLNQGYVIETGNITGTDEKKNNLIVPFYYFMDDSDIEQLVIDNVEFLNNNSVKLFFNKPLDAVTAGNINNYKISPGIDVISAQVDVQEDQVVLVTSSHVNSIPYTLKVENVKALNDKLTEKSPLLYYTYSYLPSLRILFEGRENLEMDNVAIGEKYYVDRNYILTAIPDEMKNARMIKTPNNDKDKTDERYFTLQLTNDAVVYIAYDSRASSYPEWLLYNFTKTKLNLGVTDPVEKLDVWKGLFEGGEIVLGGNNAKGAADVRSMYLVIVNEISSDVLFDEKPPGTPSSTETKPETFNLFQNYPNPFNPETTIRFEISSEMFVELEIYDILGRKVITLFDSKADPGFYNMIWDGRNEYGAVVATGIYFYRLNVWKAAENGSSVKKNFKSLVKKMMFLK
ncbi:T9SS type A sorting domain-containing protein [candidate division KSB1 bacterium]|nr:T9SS type A sorting domain-containing protein [candidate division KSB1 bacterium]